MKGIRELYTNKNFNLIPTKETNKNINVERDFKRLYVLQTPEMFEEREIMKMHVFNNQNKIPEIADAKIDKYKKELKMKSENIFIEKKVVKKKKKANYIKNTNNDNSFNKYKSLNFKMMDQYLTERKNEKTNSGSQSANVLKKSYSQVNSISNAELLKMINNDRKIHSTFVEKVFNDSEVYNKIRNNLLFSDHSQKYSICRTEADYMEEKLGPKFKKSRMHFSQIRSKTSTFGRNLNKSNQKEFGSSQDNYQNNFSKISIDNSFKNKKLNSKNLKSIKLRRLYSELNKFNPHNSNKIDSINPFYRKIPFQDEPNLEMIKNGVKNIKHSTIKSEYKRGLKNLTLLYGKNTDKYKIINNCDKIINIQSKISNKSKLMKVKDNLNFKILKEKTKFGKDYPLIKNIKKEVEKYENSNGVFLYGTKGGHRLANAERLFSRKYESLLDV